MNRTILQKGLLATVSPFVALAVLEGLLSLGGWFEPCRLLLPARHNGETYYYSNPAYGSLFFPRRDLPMPSPVWVREHKTPGLKRIVLLGESAAAGFPHPEFNLARTVEHIWRARHPEQPVEVVNLTMVGVNSYILRNFAREAMKLQPDAFILYAGHNEVIGPYGPASVFGRHISSINLARFNLWVRNLRLGRAVDALPVVWKGSKESLPRWMGLEEFKDTPILNRDERLDVMARHMEQNFRDLIDDAVDNDIRVLVAVPAANLTDWPPLGSEDSQYTDEEADALLSGGRGDLVSSAYQVYRLAKTTAEEGRVDQAWTLYRRALDLDTFRFRADSRIRRVFQSFEGVWSSKDVRIIDVDLALHERNYRFSSDREYFCEHVHLTFAGRTAVSTMMTDGLMSLLDIHSVSGSPVLSVADMAKRMLFTPMDEYAIWQEVWRLLSLDVFTGQPEGEERLAYIATTVRQLRSEITNHWNPSALAKAYAVAGELNPDDPMLDMIAGRNFMDLGEWGAARDALLKGLSRWPSYHSGWCDYAAVSMATMNLSEAARALDQAGRYSVDNPRLPALRGEWYARSGDYVQAQQALEIAVSNRPMHYHSLVNLANVYALQQMNRQAIDIYGRCIDLNDADALVLNNRSWLVASSTNFPPHEYALALNQAERAVFLQPDRPRYQATLALSLASNNRRSEAIEMARHAIEKMSKGNDIQGVTELVDALGVWGIILPAN